MKYGRGRHNNGYIGSMQRDQPYGPCNIQKHYNIENKINVSTDFSIERHVKYQRPSDWLAMPDMTSGDRMVAILLDVVKGASGNIGATADSNFIAFAMSGPYIVDWGDGTTQAFAAGATATYRYNFASVSGGASTENSLGNRQVIVQAYPQSGSDFVWIDFNRRHPLPWRPAIATYEYIKDIKIAAPNLRALNFAQSGVIPGNNTASQVALRHLEKVEFVGETGITNASSMFTTLRSMRAIKGKEWSKHVGNWSLAFNNLYKFVDLLDLDMSGAGLSFPNLFDNSTTPLTQTFSSCYALRYVPELNWTKANGARQTFQACSRLDKIEKINIGNALSEYTSQLFSFCTALREFPGFKGSPTLGNTLSATGATTPDSRKIAYPWIAAPWAGCFGLTRVGDFDIRNVRTTEQLFSGTFPLLSLAYAPMLDTRNMVSANNMFGAAFRLKTFPPYDFSNCHSIQGVFGSCMSVPFFPSHMKWPTGTGPGVTSQNPQGVNYSFMFNGCYGMGFNPDTFNLNTTGGVNFTNMFAFCKGMREAPKLNLSSALNIEGLFNESNNIQDFTNVNYYDTGKVKTFGTMFRFCLGLTAAPSFSVTSGTTFSSMFNNCYRLAIPPDVSGWGGTGMTVSTNSMFVNCYTLGTVPEAYTKLETYDFSKVKNASQMFFGTNLSKLPCKNWNTSGVINLSSFSIGGFANWSPMEIDFLDISGVTHNNNLSSFPIDSAFRNSLRAISLTGTRASINVSNSMLSATQLNDLFRGLSAGRGGLTPGTIRTCTITNNPGAATCDRTIATAKGWSVSG